MANKRENLGPRDGLVQLLAPLFALAMVTGCWWSSARAQSTAGMIQGTITDSSGAVIPRAAVTATNLETNLQRVVESNATGFYVIANLPPGTYRIQVSQPGFQTSVRENVGLTVGQQLTLPVSLQIGEISQQVTVVGEASELPSTTSEVSGIISPTRVQELPLLGRDFRDLVTLLPGVVPIPASYTQGSVTTSGLRAFRTSISGGRTTESAYYLDGLYINDINGYAPAGVSGGQLGIDLVREFRVLINSYTAEHGRAGSGVINIVSRAGTNSFHGSVFEFLRNDKLNARNFFDTTDRDGDGKADKPPQRRNQFGFAVGGPIQKDKTFFFLSWEGFRGREGQTKISIVPDLNTRNGLDASGRPVPIAISAPVFRAVMDLYPLPSGRNFGDGTALSNVQLSVPTRDDLSNLRLDRTLGASHKIFLRYTLDDGVNRLPKPVPTFEQQNRRRVHWISLQEDWIVNSQLVNTFRAGLARSVTRVTENPSAGTRVDPVVRIPGRFDVPLFSIGQLNETGQSNPSQQGPEAFNVYQYSDDLVFNRGSHTVKFGGRLERQQRNLSRDVLSADGRAVQSGRWRFLTLSDFFAGRPLELRDAIGVIGRQGGMRQTLGAGYVQDEYRILSNLTLNLGLRVEKMTPPSYNFPTYQLQDIFSSDANTPRDFLYKSNAVVAPRVGLAWSPRKADATFAIRGGIGFFYDQLGRGFWSNGYALQHPYFNQTILNEQTLRGRVPFPDPYPGGVYPAAARFSVNWAYEPYQNVPTSYQYNLTVAKTLRSWVHTTASYVGSQARHLIGSKSANTYPRSTVNGRTFYDQRGPTRNPNWGADILLNTTEGNSYYHSFQLSVNTQLAAGSSLQGSYTWSKCIDLISADNTGDFGGLREKYYYDAYNLRNERGLCNMDVRHRAAFNIVYPLPFRGLQGIGKIFLDGWSVSSIVQLSTGAPFSPKVSFPRSNNIQSATAGNNNMERPDLAPGAVRSRLVRGGWVQYFDPQAFVLQPPGSLGTAGRSIIVGPGIATVDLSLVRAIPLGKEGVQLQFRGEMFNLFNRVNFGLPEARVFTNNTGFRNQSAGTISNTSTDSRQMQLALKFVF